MITLITGIPGSGKTAHVVEMILKELQAERKIYSIGIPDLVANHTVPDETAPNGERVFAVEQAGNPRTWQKGTWLGIDTYEKPAETEEDFTDEELAEDVGSSSWVDNGNGKPDAGALVIIDECQTFFRPRSTTAKVPEYIAAFEVHRHQGLDFWILTQSPNLIDGNLKRLVSRHIHIHTTSMGKKRLEWAEQQDPNNRSSRATANIKRYNPNPKVFDLYRSATKHTKLKIKLPNGVYTLGIAFVVLVAFVYTLYGRFDERINPASSKPLPITQTLQHAEQASGAATRAVPPVTNAEKSYIDKLFTEHELVYEGMIQHGKSVTGWISFWKGSTMTIRLSFEELRSFGAKLSYPRFDSYFMALTYNDKKFYAITKTPGSDETNNSNLQPFKNPYTVDNEQI